MSPKTTTNRYDALHDLSPKHLAVLDALEAGATQEEAAQVANVHRVTVTHWANKHPAFIAERNRRAGERAQLVSERVDRVTARAIDVVGGAVENGDLKAALAWLGRVGNLTAQRSFGPTDPAVVLREASGDSIDELDDLFNAGARQATEDRLRAEFRNDEAWTTESASS